MEPEYKRVHLGVLMGCVCVLAGCATTEQRIPKIERLSQDEAGLTAQPARQPMPLSEVVSMVDRKSTRLNSSHT